jgi:signal peptidase I
VVRAALLAFATFAFPGLAQGSVKRTRRMVSWIAATAASALAIHLTAWAGIVWVAVHLASAIDGGIVARRDARPGNTNGPRIAIAVVLGAIIFGFARLTTPGYLVPTSSMYPTLVIGDHIYVDTLALRVRGIRRGDVVAHLYPCDRSRTYLKRVIALGGDTIEVRCDVLYVNGKPSPRVLEDDHASYHEDDGATRSISRYRETLDGHDHAIFAQPRQGERDFPRLGFPFAPSCAMTDYAGDQTLPQPQGRIVTSNPSAGPCEPQAQYVVPEGAVFVMGDNRNNSNDSRIFGAIAQTDVVGTVIGIWLSNGLDGGWRRIGAVN